MATTAGSFHPGRLLRRWRDVPFGADTVVLYSFTNKGLTGHTAWGIGGLYSSFRPTSGGAPAGSRPVPLPNGTVMPLNIKRQYPQRIQSLEADVAQYGEPEVLEVPGLNAAAMRAVARVTYLDETFIGPPQYPYVLATVTGPDGLTTPRHNCVVHALTLFAAGLAGTKPSPAFLHLHPAFAAGSLACNFKGYIQVRDVRAACEDYVRLSPPG